MSKSLRIAEHSDVSRVGSREIWLQILSGDRNALELLFHRYYDDLYRYAVSFCGRPDMAEDHIQKLFLKIWQRRDTLDEVSGVKTYLWTSLRRSMIDAFRKEKTEAQYLGRVSKQRSGVQLDPEELIIHEEIGTIRRRALEKAIDELSPRQQEVVYLKFYDGMSYKEIEQIMSISYQTSRNYICQALQSLKQMLKPEVMTSLLCLLMLLLP